MEQLKKAIFTVGYGQLEFEPFLELIRSQSIEYVVDVRSKPYSRFRPEFCKDTLSGFLSRAGISYVFMGDSLGGRPNDEACYQNGRVDYEKCRERPAYLAGIDRLQTAFSKGIRVAVMCSEAQPERCHRSKLIAESLDSLSIPVLHIIQDHSLLSQKELMDSARDPQEDLFGHDSNMNFSRKRYTT